MVLVNLVYDQLDGLRLIGIVQPDRLIEIHFFLRQFVVVHQHHQVIALVFGVGLAQRNLDRAFPLETFGFCQIEFKETSLASLFEGDQFVVISRDRAAQLVMRPN